MRIPDDLLVRIDEACEGTNRTAWLLGLVEAELDGSGPDQPVDIGLVAGLPAASEIPPGRIPSPGIACSWPECWARDTHRFGVTDPSELTRGGYRERPRDPEACGSTLCPTHSAKLNGFRYVRPPQAPGPPRAPAEPA
jgi:hypothetical protein